ncbi:MAG: rRNA maturation RNase YbeY [Buchnera aphidicola (Kaburagia rhusicola rhusicola)]
MTAIIIDLQTACSKKSYFPKKSKYLEWIQASLNKKKINVEITIRVVRTCEMQFLNYKYRNKNKTTNILSFPSTTYKTMQSYFIGDLIICSDVIKKEANTYNKNIESHWAHMIVHGTLHLLGYDHKNYYNLKKMQRLETKIMLSLGYKNPYLE